MKLKKYINSFDEITNKKYYLLIPTDKKSRLNISWIIHLTLFFRINLSIQCSYYSIIFK